MNFLTWLTGPMIDNHKRGPQHTSEQRAQYEADGFVYCDILAELDQPAACDKHRELVNDAAIEALQRKIVERGGTVQNIGAYYTPEPIIAAIESGSFVTNGSKSRKKL